MKYFASLIFCLLIVFAVAAMEFQSYAQLPLAISIFGQLPQQVTLRDQFVESMGEVIRLEFFSAPVHKIDVETGEEYEIRDSSTHLAWYELREDDQVEQLERIVKFTNQYSEDPQEWRIGKATHLIVPTAKLSVNGEATGNTNELNEWKHFKCYEVLDPQEIDPKDFNLDDQFVYEENVVIKPMYFCTPVVKNNGIPAKEVEEFLVGEHLACYLIEERELDNPINVEISNQFGEDELDLEASYMLCIPSEKLEWQELGPINP